MRETAREGAVHDRPDPIVLKRLYWRSRRGLLELDLLLERFWEQVATLSVSELAAYQRLLDLADHDLLDIVSGKAKPKDDDMAWVVAMMLRAI